MKTRLLTLCFICVLKVTHGDLIDTSGNLHFDTQSDGSPDLSLSNDGLGVGTTTSQANLHVSGNAALIQGNFGIGISSANSSIEVNGSMGMNFESLSANAVLSGNSVVLVDTSSAGNIDLTLPNPATHTGRQYQIKKITAGNSVNIFGIIDGGDKLELKDSGNALPHVSLVNGGNTWYITSMDGENQFTDVGSDNLVVHWTMDEGSGDKVNSSIGGNQGSRLNFETTGNGWRDDGKISGAVNFDGVNDYVNIPYHASIHPGNTQTTAGAWVYPTGGAGNFRAVLGNRDHPTKGYVIYASSADQWQVWVYDGSTAQMITGSAVTLNAWSHVMFTVAGNGTKLYVNGEEVASSTEEYVVQSAQATTIGVQSGFYFMGNIDDVRIYDKTLSADEVRSLYRSGSERP